MQSIECSFCNEQRNADQPGCVFCGRPAGSAVRELQRVGAVQEVDEVVLASLRARDYLVMQTENSVYRLTMVEPARRRGVLSGGKLGSRGIRVTLVATTPTNAQGMGSQIMTIRRHSRALFLIDAEESFEHFITSVITKLTQVKGGQMTLPAVDR